MALDRKAFFDAVRAQPFGHALTQGQVEGCNLILDEWERRKLADIRRLAYMLATAKWETASTMRPIAEYGKGAGRSYGKPDALTGKTYYGRGLVQLTWKANYEKAGKAVGTNLVGIPDLAMQPSIAVKIMFDGMAEGWFTGKKLSDYFSATKDDPRGARRIINGTDKADTIATIHRQFYAALKAAGAAAPPVVAKSTAPQGTASAAVATGAVVAATQAGGLGIIPMIAIGVAGLALAAVVYLVIANMRRGSE